MGELDEALKEFLVESAEGLDRMEQDLVVLEKKPSDKETLSSAFRAIHSIKSTCGFLGFSRLETLTHSAETVLGRLRDGEILFNAEITSALLALIDAIRAMLAAIEATGSDGEKNYESLINRFDAIRDAAASSKQTENTSGAAENPFESIEKHSTSAAENSIRVDVGLLDKLMNVVGELVLARNQILQYASTQTDSHIISASQRLNLITTELQEGLMKTRMQPISNIWNAFPRLVRDLELQCDKKVHLIREGSDTELDRTILQSVKDPLTHLLRNAIDHGLESPEDREKTGKPAEGRLHLRAFHESGYVIIDVTDDGRGIYPEKIAQRALERGLITAEQTARMSDREILALLFRPGFSTATHVTNISGRGVGLDVVKTNIEKLGGTVDVHSIPGKGTSFKVKIPLTLAIIPALVISCKGERYAIPQVNLLELVRLEGDEIHQKIERIQGALVYRLRGKLLPLVDLREVLQVATRTEQNGEVNVVVLQADDREFGMIVDSVHDTEEIVVKPLGKHLKSLGCFAGATIMGDGRVALILDTLNIAQRAKVLAEAKTAAPRKTGTDAATKIDESHTLLLFGINNGERAAIPLSLVARLEEFPANLVERSGGRMVVQYRDRILPLIWLSDLLSGNGKHEHPLPDVIQVVVHSDTDRQVGLVVDSIVDIVEEHVAIQRSSSDSGVLGSAVVQGRVTNLLDLPKVIANARSSLLGVQEELH